MHQILVYSDSLSWGIVPETRLRLPFDERWPGVLENQLNGSQRRRVRVIEDCLNGRRTVWDDPFKPGRNGLQGLGERIELNSPLSAVILMLGTNDFQFCHPHNDAWSAAEGNAALIRAIRNSPLEPGMPMPEIVLVSPPQIARPAEPWLTSSATPTRAASGWRLSTGGSPRVSAVISSMPKRPLEPVASTGYIWTPINTWHSVRPWRR